MNSSPEAPSYQDVPVLKEPVWIWSVPAYFFVGGAAGAASLLAAVADVAGDDELRPLVEKGRAIGAVGGAISTALLVIDLGRPERFLNMLRVFRITSPMSIGSWILAATAPLMATSALLARAPGRWRTTGDVAGTVAGALGLPLSGYTAVLISSTSIPAWHEARRALPWMFVASAIGGGSAILELSDLDDREARVVRRFSLLGRAAELIAMRAVERDANHVEQVGRAYRTGVAGALLSAARVAGGAALVASILGSRRAGVRRLGALCGAFSSAAHKFGTFYAGKASARDPRAVFELQRAPRRP